MPADRIERVNELLARELSRLIEADAENLGMVSVVAVDTNRDLSSAQIFVMPVAGDPDPKLLLKLTERGREYRRLLGRKLDLYRVPDFHFVFDTVGETIGRVEELLDQVAREHV